uniref:Uncharacterized protein n=1 Tax=Oryza glaberrima TaxID=4538 RepID=I1R7E6_ORYGL
MEELAAAKQQLGAKCRELEQKSDELEDLRRKKKIQESETDAGVHQQQQHHEKSSPEPGPELVQSKGLLLLAHLLDGFSVEFESVCDAGRTLIKYGDMA